MKKIESKRDKSNQLVLITTKADKLIFPDNTENLNLLQQKFEKAMNDAEIQKRLDRLVEIMAVLCLSKFGKICKIRIFIKNA